MAYLVTGGTGLVGSRIVRGLVKAGEQVVAYELCPDESMLELLLTEDEIARVTVVQGDVVDFNYLMYTVKENNVDTIIHTAAVLGLAAIPKEAVKANPLWATKVNTEGLVNVFEIARLLGLKKVVWTSSSAVFTAGNYTEEYIPNDAPHYPMGLYGASKSFGERAADYYFNGFGMDITAVRYGAFIYGAGQHGPGGFTKHIIQQLILNPAQGELGKVPWGDSLIGWLYADDAARAALLAVKHRRVKTGAFNIPGNLHPIREVADYIKELIPDADIEVQPGALKGTSFKLDTSATEAELGYYPQWTMRDAVKETVNLVRGQHGLPLV